MMLLLGLIVIGLALICATLWTGECVTEVFKIMMEEEMAKMETEYLTNHGAYEED